MAHAKKQSTDYPALQQELSEILLRMQDETSMLDDSLKDYERGLQIITELEVYLKTAENTVTELKANFNG